MDFLNKLGKKASETYQVTKEKTVKFSEEMKLKGKINDSKEKIVELYKEIGEKVYNQYKANVEEGKEEIPEKCEEISNHFDEITRLESEILSLKSAKKCSNCGEEIKSDDRFCSKCGTEQTKQEENVEIKEESELQDVQDAEVTEIRDTEKTEEKVDDEENKIEEDNEQED